MGRLNFKTIDENASDVYSRENFAGGPQMFDWRVRNLAKRKVPHTIRTEGNIGVISVNGVKYRYTLKVKEEVTGKDAEEIKNKKKELESEVIRIMQCCKAVRREVRKFLKTNEPYPSGRAESVFVSQAATGFFIHSGGREIDLVDIKCCYWTVLKNFGIISEETFEEYKNERDPRLISVGCLKRAEHIKYHSGERMEGNEINRSNFEWVWDFVVYKTYQAIKTVCEAVGWKVFSYITDGIYLPREHTERAVEILTQLGFKVVVKGYKVVGYMGHWMVLENKETGFYKRANLGISLGIKAELREVSKEEYEKRSSAEEEDNLLKSNNVAAVKNAEEQFSQYNGYIEAGA